MGISFNKRIMGPAMIVTWLFGLLLIIVPGIIDWSQGWIWVKFLCVIGMTGFHGFLSKQRKLLEKMNAHILDDNIDF